MINMNNHWMRSISNVSVVRLFGSFCFYWALLLGGLTAAGVGFFYPLEWHALTERVDFWRTGVQSQVRGSSHAWVRDDCQQGHGARVAANCTCVLMIHGLGDSARTWKKLLLMSQQEWGEAGHAGPLLRVAVDLPGMGDSPPPPSLEGYRARKQAQEISQWLGPSCAQWLVVGNSLGGWVGSWLALDFPSRVRRLVLLSPAGLKEPWQTLTPLLAQTPTEELLKDFQKRAYAHPKALPERVWREMVKKAQKASLSVIAGAQNEEDFLDHRLISLRPPVILGWGQEDHVLPLNLGYRMRSLLPSTSLWREFPQCGHLPQKECPEQVVQAIVEMNRFGVM